MKSLISGIRFWGGAAFALISDCVRPQPADPRSQADEAHTPH